MKRLLFLVVLVLFLINLKGYSQYDSEFKLPQVIPPSPTSSSLGQYGQVPVGLFTGTPNVSIPIYTINQENLAIPISLSYGSNGIRVDQIATELGLGWSLNAGGVITRVLRDEMDEAHRVNLPDAGLSSQEMRDFLYSVINGTGQDSQPDLFSFNFNGYSGKFYLDSNMEPRLIDPLPIKIERLTSTYKITDPEGVVYYFGEGNSYEESANRTYGIGDGSNNIMSEPVTTAW